jgi:hypothetical protein
VTTLLRPWLIWIAGFIAFPIAGIAGGLAVGRVDSPLAALIGGLVTGAVLGAGQSLASSRRLDWHRWVPATAAGMSLGLAAGATAVGFRTSLVDLVVMGAITGVALGVAQAGALPGPVRNRLAWAAALPALWALGWTVTTLGGIAVEEQFTVFGSFGAIAFSALSGALLHLLIPARSTDSIGAPA